jgi:uncharacterized protein
MREHVMIGTNSTLQFETNSGGRYIYDDDTGAVLPVNGILSKALELSRKLPPHRVRLELLNEFPQDLVDGTLKFLGRWRNTYGGLYRTPRETATRRHQKNSVSREDVATTIIDNPSYYRQLILNLTENCNLKCKYCIFSDSYTYTRSPTKKTMSFETSRKAVDYFFSLNESLARRNPGKFIAINFYGGEPLLGFSTLKKIVPYIRQNSPLRFLLLMTTNGLLLNDEIVDFIVENDIHVAVSLDGTKENHDRNRITHNGKGSWDTVRNNLARFMERYPEFVLRNVSIISVYDFKTDLEETARFFEQESLPRVSFIDGVVLGTEGDSYYSQFTEAEKARFVEQDQKLMGRYFQHLIDGTRPSDFLSVFCGSRFINILYRKAAYDHRPGILPYSGTCVPGEKISVRPDGVFDVCERVNSSMPIGDVDRGLDIEAISTMMDKYRTALGDNCLSCPATKVCNICFGDGTCMEDNKFSVTADRCNRIRSRMTQDLELVYSMRELKPNAFEQVDELLSRPEKIHNF